MAPVRQLTAHSGSPGRTSVTPWARSPRNEEAQVGGLVPLTWAFVRRAGEIRTPDLLTPSQAR